MSNGLFRKYIDIITENDTAYSYQGDFEPRQLQPAELQVLNGKAVQQWARQLGIDLSSAQSGLYNLDSGAQVPAITVPLKTPLDPDTFEEMQRALTSIGVLPISSNRTLVLAKTR